MLSFTIDVRFDYDPPDDAADEQVQALLDAGLLDHLQQAAVQTLLHQAWEGSAALTILLTDDDALQAMNREFRGYDQPTDVLSFESDFEMPEIGRYIGDIAISVPTAIRQAAENGARPWAELELLAVHGVLHLLGHDHADDDEKAVMWLAQDEILAKIR